MTSFFIGQKPTPSKGLPEGLSRRTRFILRLEISLEVGEKDFKIGNSKLNHPSGRPIVISIVLNSYRILMPLRLAGKAGVKKYRSPRGRGTVRELSTLRDCRIRKEE